MGTKEANARAKAASEACTNGLSAETAAEFREFLRGRVRALIVEVMREEVELLCGPAHHPDADAHDYRAGSAPGYVLHEGRRLDVARPRVRRLPICL